MDYITNDNCEKSKEDHEWGGASGDGTFGEDGASDEGPEEREELGRFESDLARDLSSSEGLDDFDDSAGGDGGVAFCVLLVNLETA